jgi:putative transposase
MPVADICRKAGISPATYFNWKKRYDGMQVLLRRSIAFARSRAGTIYR